MATTKKLPVFDFIVSDGDDDTGIVAVSMVEYPAIESNFIAFDESVPKVKFVQADGYEQIVMGLSLIPDKLIYRVDTVLGEYYGKFTADMIKKMVYKFHKNLYNNMVNVDHDDDSYVNAYMVEDYIIQSELQVQMLKEKGIEEAVIGAWVTAYKIENPAVFQRVLNGDFKGFSIEAYLDKQIVHMNNENKQTEIKKMKKTLKERILAIFEEEKFERVLVPEFGFEIEYTGVGEVVNKVVINEDGSETLELIGQGEFVTEIGILVTDEASILLEIKELPVEPVEEPELEPEPEPIIEEEDYKALYDALKANTDATIADLQSQVDALKLRIIEPITEPVINPEPVKKDPSKMTAYERLMAERGISAV